jgi:DNA-binding CsgD family transcriptional regulator
MTPSRRAAKLGHKPAVEVRWLQRSEMTRMSKNVAKIMARCPPLPLAADHWQAVVEAMGISEQQAKVVELVLRDLRTKEIVAVTRLSEGTVKDYLKRVGQRTGTRGRMQLAMRVLALSHEVLGDPWGESKAVTSIRMASEKAASRDWLRRIAWTFRRFQLRVIRPTDVIGTDA